MNTRLLIAQNSRFNNVDVSALHLNIHCSQIVEECDALSIDQQQTKIEDLIDLETHEVHSTHESILLSNCSRLLDLVSREMLRDVLIKIVSRVLVDVFVTIKTNVFSFLCFLRKSIHFEVLDKRDSTKLFILL